MFGNVCRGIPGERYEELISEVGRDLDAEGLKALTARFKQVFTDETGEEFPQDPQEQLRQAVRAVFDSWLGDRAVAYRRINHIPDDWGTAVNVQQMVFGNKGETSGSGVAFSRDEVTGAPEPSGDFLAYAQGEDVVAGIRTPQPISHMKDELPESYAEFERIGQRLEKHYKDVQDLEFTIERGRLYMLQTRSAKRTAAAAVRIASDMVDEGIITEREALSRIEDRMPGTRIVFYRGFLDPSNPLRIGPEAEAPAEAAGTPQACASCGAPTYTETCSFCRLKERVRTARSLRAAKVSR